MSETDSDFDSAATIMTMTEINMSSLIRIPTEISRIPVLFIHGE